MLEKLVQQRSGFSANILLLLSHYHWKTEVSLHNHYWSYIKIHLQVLKKKITITQINVSREKICCFFSFNEYTEIDISSEGKKKHYVSDQQKMTNIIAFLFFCMLPHCDGVVRLYVPYIYHVLSPLSNQ